MWDRYDARGDARDLDVSWERGVGSRDGTSDLDRNDERCRGDAFTRNLDLARGRERRPVRERERVYEINGTESRMLATVGTFRVVADSDLHDIREDSESSRRALKHLEKEGLIRTSPLSSDDRAVTLTDRGRDLLEANRYERHDRSHEPRQTFQAGLRKPRKLTHDTKVYRAYQRAEERLRCRADDLFRRPIRSAVAFLLAAITLMKEPLIVPLELVVEDDPPNPTTPGRGNAIFRTTMGTFAFRTPASSRRP